MASNLTALTWLRSEWDKVQTSGTEGGYYGENRMRISYDEYLKNAGFKSEAEAIAKRAEEEASGLKFGEVKSWDEKAQLAERKGTPEYLKELDESHARLRAEEAKRIALLSRGTITGQEPVYIIGTKENNEWVRNNGFEIPNAYLDAQAFAARYMAYDRLGSNDPNSPSYDAATGTWGTKPSPFYDPKIMVPIVGMGNRWSALNNKMWATVQGGQGSTPETDAVVYEMDVMWRNQIGYPPGATIRDYNELQAAGGVVAGGAGGGVTGAGSGSGGTITKTAATSNMDAATKALVQSLEKQISDLSAKFTQTETAAAAEAAASQYNQRMSVYSSMADRFNKYGLSSLGNKIKELAIKGATEATITLELMETPEAQQRFSANAERLKKGIAALTPGEYVTAEDGYRQVLRSYGLKQFDNDAYVKQFLANGTSPTEISNRVVTAVQRVQNADPAIIKQLKDYYGIGEQDMVGYVLDPEQEFLRIERQISAAEIGVAAGRQGITAGESVARQLAAQGVTEKQAQEGYAKIAEYLPTAEKLSDIYGSTMDKFGQSEAEQIEFNSLASAQRKRDALRAREIAAFSGSSGTNKTSLTTSNVGQF
jgi:hypothetical protein